MTEPSEFELLELATPYALDAVSDDERAVIERRVAQAPAAMADAFHAEVRAVRETLAVVSAATAVQPPPQVRARVLAAASPPRRKVRWRTTLLAAAAALAIGLGALTAGLALRPAQPPSTVAQVFAAPDVHTVSGLIPGGGTATVVFSREKNAGVLVMNDVPPPKPDTVYQMWLIGDGGRHPRARWTKGGLPVDHGCAAQTRNSTALAFTVEPGKGSVRPTGPAIAALPLT